MARLIIDGYVKKARTWHHCDCCDSILQSDCTFSDYELTFLFDVKLSDSS